MSVEIHATATAFCNPQCSQRHAMHASARIHSPFILLCAADQDIVYGYMYYNTPRISTHPQPRLPLLPLLAYSCDLLNLTMYPITPIIRKPMPTAWLMRRNSRLSATESRQISPYCRPMTFLACGMRGVDIRLLHLVTNCLPSFRNSRGISRSSFAWSIFAGSCNLNLEFGERDVRYALVFVLFRFDQYGLLGR